MMNLTKAKKCGSEKKSRATVESLARCEGAKRLSQILLTLHRDETVVLFW